MESTLELRYCSGIYLWLHVVVQISLVYECNPPPPTPHENRQIMVRQPQEKYGIERWGGGGGKITQTGTFSYLPNKVFDNRCSYFWISLGRQEHCWKVNLKLNQNNTLLPVLSSTAQVIRQSLWTNEIRTCRLLHLSLQCFQHRTSPYSITHASNTELTRIN